MKMFAGTELESGRKNAALQAADSASLTAISVISRFSSTRFLRVEQSNSNHVQIGERRRDFEPVQVLRQATVAGLAEAEDVFDHAKHVLNLGAHPRLVAVLCFLDFVDLSVESVALVREIL